MHKDAEFVAYLLDLLQAVGPVSARRMFGGHGIFLDGLMFGLVADNTFYLKVDEQVVEAFKAQGMQPFEYAKQGRLMQLSYYQAPEESLESSEQMIVWANRGLAAAMRAAGSRRKTRR